MVNLKNIVLRLSLSIVLITVSFFPVLGDGMWIPSLIKMLNESEMQSLGMKLSAEDIYSINQTSLKDAIVHFGGFCTSEVISPNGLILTNHHCGYRQIQSHSSIDDNYLKNGFWASSYAEEKSNPGLFARFIEKIEDVTGIILKGVTEDMTVAERKAVTDRNINALRNSLELAPFHGVIIRPFYHGNQYFMFYTKTYHDVRLVGTPPESVGKFGADTDNWVWPRHTGDFSLFRIYAGPDNEPAEYSPDNKPFTPKHFFPISLDGVEDGDFTLVFGFPGRTNQYLSSYAVEQIKDKINPANIAIRDITLKILGEQMRKDEMTRLKYSPRFASIANSWKRWIGEINGLNSKQAVEKKQLFEKEFTERAKEKYKDLLPQFKKYYTEIESLAILRNIYNETALRNIEISRVVGQMRGLVNAYNSGGESAYNKRLTSVNSFLQDFHKNYDPSLDEKVFVALLNQYKKEVAPDYRPSSIHQDWQSLFSSSFLSNTDELNAVLQNGNTNAVVNTLLDDPLYQFFSEWAGIYNDKINIPFGAIQGKIDSLQRIYMQAMMETFPDRQFFPDANSTLRVTYGKVNGYTPRDAVSFNPVTYFDGVIEKYVPGDYEFDLDEKLRELYTNKDYGRYADETGKVPVCFIGTNHTTGGNSGSPAIDANGNLIGINFDRAWEGVMSDLFYDPSICRNIMVDIRYVLFIVDKYAGAKRLIDEMKFVYPKTGED